MRMDSPRFPMYGGSSKNLIKIEIDYSEEYGREQGEIMKYLKVKQCIKLSFINMYLYTKPSIFNVNSFLEKIEIETIADLRIQLEKFYRFACIN